MANIEKTRDVKTGLTIFTVNGDVSSKEIVREVNDFYDHGPITRNVLWDLTGAILSEFDAEDVQQVSGLLHKPLDLRKDGKTAIVAPGDLVYGLSRMYQSNLPEEQFPFVTRVFRDREEADHWLAGD